jgi:hypothetical protein
MTLIEPNLKLIFFLAEKCASTSIREALLVDGWERFQMNPSSFSKSEGPWTSWETSKCYGIVRNPYSRMVSYWSYWLKTGVYRHSFESFILKRERKPDHASLVEWYKDVKIDHYFKFEKFHDEFGKFPYFKDLKLANLNSSSHSGWEKYYKNPELILRVNEWAGEDFKAYGYEKIGV